MKTPQPVHLGKLIKERMEEHKMSVADFAKKLDRSRENIYNLFEREHFNTELLEKIGRILEYDFFRHLVTNDQGSTIKNTQDVKDFYESPSLERCMEENRILRDALEAQKRVIIMQDEKLSSLSHKGRTGT
jgi:predicted transcriptional regulator